MAPRLKNFENSLFKTMAELEKLRLARELDPPTEQPTAKGAPPSGAEPVARNKANVAGPDPSAALGVTGAVAPTSGRNDKGPGDNCVKQSQSWPRRPRH